MQRWSLIAVSFLVAGWLVASCQQVKPNASATEQPAKVAKAQTDDKHADHKHAGDKHAGDKHAGDKHADHKHAGAQGGHDCTQGGSTKIASTKVTEKVGPDGKKVLHAGAVFGDGTATVNVADLLAKPDSFKGKKIRLSGNVSAMCNHRRGWFALASSDKTGGFVRVITAPAFLVPTGAIGKVARAEGTVEVIEVQAAAAKHYAKDHKLGSAGAIKGAQKRVVLRASGADFS